MNLSSFGNSPAQAVSLAGDDSQNWSLTRRPADAHAQEAIRMMYHNGQQQWPLATQDDDYAQWRTRDNVSEYD